MKRYSIFILVFLIVIAPIKAEATISAGYTVISKSEKDSITIYAKKIDGLFRDFKIDFKGIILFRPFWMNITNPTYAPDIYYEDIDKDVKKELIIILTLGSGTGALVQEVYVFKHINGLIDVLVDNPLAIINKNVKSKLTAEKAEVQIDAKDYIVDITPLEIKPENLFDDIGFGSIIKYEVKDNQLVAKIPGQISPAGYIGEIVIVYVYKDKMFQAKSILFQPEEI